MRAVLPLILLPAFFPAPAAAAPGDMNAQTFYTRAVALEKRGMAAMFSSELKPMMAEMKAAGSALRQQNEAAKARGAPLYCPPQERNGWTPRAIIDGLAAIPEERRRSMTITDAFREMLVRRFPCD